MNYDYTDAQINEDLGTLQYGFDPKAAWRLIEHWFACLDEGEPLNFRLLRQYLIHVLGEIRKGKAPGVASLSLSRVLAL